MLLTLVPSLEISSRNLETSFLTFPSPIVWNMIDEVLKINTVSQKHQGKTERKINIDQLNLYYRFFWTKSFWLVCNFGFLCSCKYILCMKRNEIWHYCIQVCTEEILLYFAETLLFMGIVHDSNNPQQSKRYCHLQSWQQYSIFIAKLFFKLYHIFYRWECPQYSIFCVNP